MSDPDRHAAWRGFTRRGLGVAALSAGLSEPALAQRQAEGGRRPAASHAALSPGVVMLGDRLLTDLGLRPRQASYLLSPYNLHATLGMLALGARGAGAGAFAQALGLARMTPPEMAAAMGNGRDSVRGLSASGSEVTLAYSTWTRPGNSFQLQWQDQVGRAAAPRLRRIDFGSPNAVPTINGWAREATRGQIPRVVEELGRDTELVLAGAIHFAGKWAQPFPKDATAPAPFHRLDGSSAAVPMMTLDAPLPYGQQGLGHVVRLPYAGGRLAMWVAAARRVEDSAAFLDMLSAAGPAHWILETVLRTGLTNVRLPRMSFAAGGDMLAPLRAAGFGEALAADFRGILGRPVQPAQIAHQARIRVDEEGTVAAAATAIVGTRSMPEMSVFAADRPFVFVLGAVDPWLPLFVGYVGDASSAQG
jgi:serpin B